MRSVYHLGPAVLHLPQPKVVLHFHEFPTRLMIRGGQAFSEVAYRAPNLDPGAGREGRSVGRPLDQPLGQLARRLVDHVVAEPDRARLGFVTRLFVPGQDLPRSLQLGGCR